MSIQINRAVSAAELEACMAIRNEVFIVGQNVPAEREVDGLDGEARHYIAQENGQPLATMRVRDLGNGVHKIERMAVLEAARGKGVAQQLMTYVLAELTAAGAAEAVLEAQTYIQKLYEKFGFVAVGEEFMDANIPHIKMIKKLNAALAA